MFPEHDQNCMYFRKLQEKELIHLMNYYTGARATNRFLNQKHIQSNYPIYKRQRGVSMRVPIPVLIA
jgi:hypothetical protein